MNDWINIFWYFRRSGGGRSDPFLATDWQAKGLCNTLTLFQAHPSVKKIFTGGILYFFSPAFSPLIQSYTFQKFSYIGACLLILFLISVIDKGVKNQTQCPKELIPWLNVEKKKKKKMVSYSFMHSRVQHTAPAVVFHAWFMFSLLSLCLLDLW